MTRTRVRGCRRPIHRDRRAATAVDFAVSIGTVLVFVTAIIDLGLLLKDKHALDYGVEKAVRYAVVNSTSATVVSIAQAFINAVKPALGSGGASQCSVNVSYPGGLLIGGSVKVSVSFPWKPVTGLDFLPGMTLTSSQTLTIQH